MATLTTISGKLLTLKIDSTSTTKVIKNLRSTSWSLSQDFDEITTRDSGSFKEYAAQFLDMTIDAAGKLTNATDAALVYGEIEDLVIAKTQIYWELGTGVSGSRKVTGRGFISSFDVDSEFDAEAEFSLSIQNTGDVTVSTYA